MWQIRRQAKLKGVADGKGEALCFDISLGFIKLVCIVHIPYEGENTSLVYVKCVKPRKEEGDG